MISKVNDTLTAMAAMAADPEGVQSRILADLELDNGIAPAASVTAPRPVGVENTLA